MLLFSVAIGLSYATVYVLARDDASERLRTSIAAEMQLVESELLEPEPEMVEILGESAAPEAVRMIFDRGGKPVGGNIESLAPFEGWRVFDAAQLQFRDKRTRESDRYLLLGKRGGEHQVIVGQGMYLEDEISEILVSAFFWGLLTVLATGLAGVGFLARRAQERLGRAEAALRRFSDGDLGRRLPVTGKGDDLDRISAAVNFALARIEELVQTVRQVSTDIAHDLKSPMTRLRQTLEAASIGRSDTAKVAIHEAIGQADAITETFDALLRIAQIEAGARRARFRALDLADILENVVDAFAPVAEDSGQLVTLSRSGAGPVRGDRELLTQLFANLVENAIGHGATGNEIKISLQTAPGDVRAAVADRGPGIPAEERERVLRRFYRLDRSRSTPGTGLGMALVKAVADLHGAHLTLRDNEPGLICELAFPRVSTSTKATQLTKP